MPSHLQSQSFKPIKAGVVGFRGYSGLELQALLGSHALVEPWLLEHRQDAVPEVHPLGRPGPPRIPATAEAAAEAGLAVVFLATPPEVSLELVPSLLARGIRVVDLSGAFRLRTMENYSVWYKVKHTEPALLAEAVYGLPEFYRDLVPGARLLSNPGCYPTAANLACGRPCARHRVRRQIGRQRGRQEAQPEDQLLRSRRELYGVLDSEPSSRA